MPRSGSPVPRGCVVAAAQMLVRRAPANAAAAVAAAVSRAARAGAGFLVTPEMILTGYHAAFRQEVRDRLIAGVIAPACARHRMTLVLGAGSYRTASGARSARPSIQAVVIGPTGRILGAHDKTIPTRGDLRWCRRGRPGRLRSFRSAGLRFGVTICNDFWATPGYTSLPDLNLPVRLARLGARVIFHAVASGHDPAYRDFHTRRIEERAIRAGVWVVSASALEDRRRPTNCPTGIVDPLGRWRFRAPLSGERLLVGRLGD